MDTHKTLALLDGFIDELKTSDRTNSEVGRITAGYKSQALDSDEPGGMLHMLSCALLTAAPTIEVRNGHRVRVENTDPALSDLMLRAWLHLHGYESLTGQPSH